VAAGIIGKTLFVRLMVRAGLSYLVLTQFELVQLYKSGKLEIFVKVSKIRCFLTENTGKT